MTVKLPIASKPHITSECWTCYKFAIMQTSPFYTDWLMSHMELVTFSTGHSTFGYNERIYSLSYFNDILNIEDGNLLKIAPDKIVNFLKKQIFRRKYAIIDLNFNKIYNSEKENFDIHETLIYGYSEEKNEFNAFMISGFGTSEVQLSFEVVKEAYSYVYQYYKENVNFYFDRRNYFAGISLISLKDKYCNSNKEYDFYKKLHRSLDKAAYKKTIVGSDYLVSEYTIGVYRYRYLAGLLTTHLEDSQYESETLIAVLKIYEYHNLTVSALRSIVEEGNEVLKRYTEYKDKFYNILQRFMKYTFTHNKEALEKIINDVNKLEVEEADLVLSCRRCVEGKIVEKLSAQEI